MQAETILYFGSFNPVHRGHVAVADAVLESTEAEALWFVVSPQNPFKAGKELAPETDRIEMARIALQSAVHSDLTDKTTGETFSTEPFPEFIQNLIANGGLVESIKKGVIK